MRDSHHSRRGFLMGAMASPLALAFAACARSADQAKGKPAGELPASVVIENFSPAGVVETRVEDWQLDAVVAQVFEHFDDRDHSVVQLAGPEQ